MKTKKSNTLLGWLIAAVIVLVMPVAALASDASATAGDAPILSASVIDILFKIVAWYGVACVAFNGLAALVSTVVKRTPGESDDLAIDRLYENKLYKAVAWVFSWGDYLAELATKLKK